MSLTPNHPSAQARRIRVRDAFLGLALGMLSVAGLAGCDSGGVPGELERGLSQGYFEYRCVGESDAFDPCGQENAFPETVAVGAQFEIHFHDEEGKEHRVTSAAPERLKEEEGQRFTVLESGYLALLATGTDASRDIRALDFLHINARPVERLGLREIDGDEDLNSLSLMHGQVRTVIARPYAAGTKQIAAGALSYTWATSNSNILTLEKLPNSRTIGLVARQPGIAVLTVTQGEIERSIDITIVGQLAPKEER